jgi:hypothetical protein
VFYDHFKGVTVEFYFKLRLKIPLLFPFIVELLLLADLVVLSECHGWSVKVVRLEVHLVRGNEVAHPLVQLATRGCDAVEHVILLVVHVCELAQGLGGLVSIDLSLLQRLQNKFGIGSVRYSELPLEVAQVFGLDRAFDSVNQFLTVLEASLPARPCLDTLFILFVPLIVAFSSHRFLDFSQRCEARLVHWVLKSVDGVF